jgi:hypothetical protein
MIIIPAVEHGMSIISPNHPRNHYATMGRPSSLLFSAQSYIKCPATVHTFESSNQTQDLSIRFILFCLFLLSPCSMNYFHQFCSLSSYFLHCSLFCLTFCCPFFAIFRLAFVIGRAGNSPFIHILKGPSHQIRFYCYAFFWSPFKRKFCQFY